MVLFGCLVEASQVSVGQNSACQVEFGAVKVTRAKQLLR